jgi:hypothetical protein
MVDALTGVVDPRPTTVPEVIDTLTRVKAAAILLDPRGDNDGIAAFTTLYKQITQSVLDNWNRGVFEAGDFIIDLDINFACRYLDAIEAMTSGGDVPKCWEALFSVRSTEKIEALNYAAAGVNAHVNFDLTFALLTTWEKHPSPAERDAQHRDYNRINDIFYANMDSLRAQFHSLFTKIDDGGWLDKIGNAFGDLLVRQTRDIAWDLAMHLWAQKGREDWEAYREAAEVRQDYIAAVLGKGLIDAPVFPA